mmetsp:Transcript_24723/g.21891  ORF Transcript_24723/g.21891 Transcript_24723/m.21891 type:complete len:215 (-) Transcript_24723:1181-1825(-)
MVQEESNDTHCHPKTVYPIIKMTFQNKRISQELYDLLMLKFSGFHANLTEKEKISRYLKVVLFDVMKFDYTNEQVYDVNIEDSSLLEIVSRIEDKIYDKSFSYNVAKAEAMVNKSKDTKKMEEVINEARLVYKRQDQIVEEEQNPKGEDEDTQNSVLNKKGENSKDKKDGGNNTKDNSQKSADDDLRLDSGSEGPPTVKEMEYIENDPENKTMF